MLNIQHILCIALTALSFLILPACDQGQKQVTVRKGRLRGQAWSPNKSTKVPSNVRMKYIAPDKVPAKGTKFALPEEKWKAKLSPEQFKILRKQGTERAFSGDYVNLKANGVYHCAGCDAPLFSADTKYKSGTGWPSFYQPIENERVGIRKDTTLGMVREEVYCLRCDGHLGHVFNDGPKPTGKRYCINSASLLFSPDKPISKTKTQTKEKK